MTVFWRFLPAPPPYDIFSNPFPPIYRKKSQRNCELSFISHYKSYMTIWPNPFSPVWRYSGDLNNPLPSEASYDIWTFP